MTKKVVNIPQHAEVAGTPATPDTGFSKIYIKTDKEWYWLDDTGLEVPFKAPIYVGKTLYVDITYGDDGTAIVNRLDKPYATYASARTAAASGDTIVFLPGSYAEGAYTLKTGVNVYCYPGVSLSGQIRDLGSPVTMKWMGYANVSFTGNNVISITGAGTNVDMEFRDLSATGVGISVDPGATATFLTLKCRNLTGTSTNYNITLRGGANAIINVEDSIQSAASTSSFITVFCRSAYSGTSYIKAKRVIIGNSTVSLAGMLFSDATSNLSTAKVYMEFETIESQYTLTGFSEFDATIMKFGPGLLSIKVGGMTTISKQCITTSNSLSTSTLIFEGKASCQQREVARIANGSGKHIFKNCLFHRTSSGSDGNRVVIIGNPTGASSLFLSESDLINTEFINSKIIKTSVGTSSDELVAVDGASSVTIFKNCEIIAINTLAGTNACNADTLAEGNIYFKNTHSNVDNTANITDTAVVSGFIGNDTNLTSLEV